MESFIPDYIVHGVKIYTNKSIHSIQGSRIYFTDNSWCDILTKEIHTTDDEGYISFVPQSRVPAHPSSAQTAFFAASEIEIQDVPVPLRIEQTEVPVITVHTPAQHLSVPLFTAHTRGSILAITGVRNGYNASISKESNPLVLLKVPRGTKIRVEGGAGGVYIDNMEGGLVVAAVNGITEIASAHNIRILSQATHIKLMKLTGNVGLKHEGSGSVRVESGSIDVLDAVCVGSGAISVFSMVKTATLEVIGSGSIYLAHVEQPPIQKVRGSGGITIDHVSPTELWKPL